MTWRVHVRILPRAGLLDPQGQAVEHALSALHFPKAIALDVAAPSAAAAEASVRAMCEKLLANPVTEDFEIAIESGGTA
jgi:phosphoribosylformylglycinamidine synthase PurS subunit